MNNETRPPVSTVTIGGKTYAVDCRDDSTERGCYRFNPHTGRTERVEAPALFALLPKRMVTQ